MIARRPILVVVSALLTLGVVIRPAGAVTTRIALKPASGPPTSKAQVNGAGFGATERVAITFDVARVGSATTDASGSFATRVRVPPTALPGNHTVVATGQTSGLTAAAPFTVRTNWSKFAFDTMNTGFNPFENVIDAANVPGLATAWTGATAGTTITSAAVVNGVAYIGSYDHTLYAFDATGTTNCSGEPGSCQPLWTATTHNAIASSPAVAAGVVYVGSEDGRLYAFDAAGVTNCSGTPKTCEPLWTSASIGIWGSAPTVVNGVVYIGVAIGVGSHYVYAFDAAGVTNCSGTPKTCTPLRSMDTGRGALFSSPAVANRVLYIGSNNNFGAGLAAFDAAGVTNCSGTPATCTPLWTANTGPVTQSSPAAANGMVYVTSDNGGLFAFDAAGVTNCSGTPRTCVPLWTSATSNVTSYPAVAGGVVYVGSFDGLAAFDGSGLTNCSGGLPARCAPLWTAPTGGLDTFDPSVANGVVYTAGSDANLYAFDATGVLNCSGTPKTCSPLWTKAGAGSAYRHPLVTNGVLYAGLGGTLEALSLP